ncbi:DUF6710 family protein [Peribacillus phoenicis]|uniref:DUF6710 family protein n=1 Tax=unclassified Peribacillus TaxID=2675266 RepID=UPI0039A0B0BE
MFKKLFSKQKTTNDKTARFNLIIDFAKSVISETQVSKDGGFENGNHPIFDVIRLLGRNLQTNYLTSLLISKNETELPSLYPEVIFMDPRTMISDDITIESLLVEVNLTKKLQLGRDLVLPWPWKRRRLINCITQIGEERKNGPWKQDYNHWVELWLPMGVAWVNSGNHSISTGIIQGQGQINTSKAIDISKLYDYIYSDGEYYYSFKNDEVISEVKNVDFAAIFEIGRLMKENDINF